MYIILQQRNSDCMRVFLLKLTVHEYIKIIYVNCGLKNYVKVDHCCCRCNMLGTGVKVSVSVSHVDFFPSFAVGRV